MEFIMTDILPWNFPGSNGFCGCVQNTPFDSKKQAF